MIAALSLALGFAALTVIGLAASSQPASAQQSFGNFFTYQPKQRKRVVRKKRAPDAENAAAPDAAAGTAQKAAAKKAAEKSGTQGFVYAIVSLPDQHINVYDASGRIATSRVSTGQSGFRTPSGIYSAVSYTHLTLPTILLV